MALYTRYFGGSGMRLDQFAHELAAVWQGTPDFEAWISNGPASTTEIFPFGLINVETDDEFSQSHSDDIAAAVASHVPASSYSFSLAAPPHSPAVGRVEYLTDVLREGSGTGCLCVWDGGDWLRVSDNAVATNA